MMTLIKLLLGLLNGAMQYAHNKELLSAGEASAIARAQKDLNDAITRSINIRRRTRGQLNELRNDKNSYRD